MFSGYVGPGFSAGTQTVQYYLTRGWIGVFIGPIIVSILTYISTYINFEMSRRYRPANFIVASNIQWRSPLLRKILAIFKDVMFILSTFVGMAAMNSTICGILAYLYQIPTWVTTLVFVVLSVFLAIYGMKVLNATGTFLTVAIIVVLFYTGFSGFKTAWPLTQQWMATKATPQDFGFAPIVGYYTMITLVGSTLTSCNPIVTSATECLEYKWQSVLASLVHALLSFIGTVIFTVLFAGLMPEVAEQTLPTLYAMCGLLGTNPLIINLFAILAIACVLSTAVTYMYGISERWAPVFNKMVPALSKFWWKFVIALFFALVSIIGNKIGLIAIVQYGYTGLGALSLPVLILPAYFMYPYRLKEDKKRGWLDEDGCWNQEKSAEDAEYSYGP
ncbi:MAG: hypothetical protein Q4B67_03615 [Eubacteriales bacterium]|nr:hypothetical protein [Eubacteriales bacterium]